MAVLDTGEIVIHDGNFHLFINPTIDGELKKCGTVPRDWARHPCGFSPFAPASSITPVPRSEWSERIRDKVARKAQLSDLRNVGMPDGTPIPSRDQNGYGYCWAHSTTSAAVLRRCRDHLPYADLSAYAIACIIKNYRDEGGWNAESMEFLAKRGCPTSEFWPQRSVNSQNDNPKTWENAALHKDTDWADIPESNNCFDVLATYLLNNIPCPSDFNWWSHSVCSTDLVDGASLYGRMRGMDSGKLITQQEFDRIWRVDDFGGAWGNRIWNSWGNSYGSNGMGILTESRGTPNGAMALLTMRASNT